MGRQLASDGLPKGQTDQIFFRIDRAVAAAQFKMQLRPAHIAGPAHPGNNLATPHDVTTLHKDDRAVRIGRHPAAGMLDQNQIAKALQLIAGIGDNAVFGGPDRGTFPRRDIDSVIVQATGARAK